MARETTKRKPAERFLFGTRGARGVMDNTSGYAFPMTMARARRMAEKQIGTIFELVPVELGTTTTGDTHMGFGVDFKRGQPMVKCQAIGIPDARVVHRWKNTTCKQCRKLMPKPKPATTKKAKRVAARRPPVRRSYNDW